MDRSLPPDLIARFAADLKRVWLGEGRLGIAVSGGADSLALLLLAQAAVTDRIAAATVDHGLRAESAGEAAMVSDLCQRFEIPHQTLRVSLAPGNVQSEARAARYAALAAWAQRERLSAVATAHHADDQAETLLMRLQRGSGVAGLAGVRSVTVMADSGLWVIRPLLGWRRGDLAALVAGAGVAAVADPSNADTRFARARLRQQLATAAWLDPVALATSAAHLAEADEALAWAAAREWDEAVVFSGDRWLYRPGAPRAVALRVLACIVAEIDEHASRGSALARFHDRLASGASASLGNVAARVSARGWVFRRARKRGGT